MIINRHITGVAMVHLIIKILVIGEPPLQIIIKQIIGVPMIIIIRLQIGTNQTMISNKTGEILILALEMIILNHPTMEIIREGNLIKEIKRRVVITVEKKDICPEIVQTRKQK